MGFRVFESVVLMRILVRRRDEVTGGCRKLHSEGLCNVYPLRYVLRP